MFGLRAARTLAKWIRSWELLELHQNASFGSLDGLCTARIIAYLRDRASEPCGHTVPGSAVTGLQFVASRCNQYLFSIMHETKYMIHL